MSVRVWAVNSRYFFLARTLHEHAGQQQLPLLGHEPQLQLKVRQHVSPAAQLRQLPVRHRALRVGGASTVKKSRAEEERGRVLSGGASRAHPSIRTDYGWNDRCNQSPSMISVYLNQSMMFGLNKYMFGT